MKFCLLQMTMDVFKMRFVVVKGHILEMKPLISSWGLKRDATSSWQCCPRPSNTAESRCSSFRPNQQEMTSSGMTNLQPWEEAPLHSSSFAS